MPQLDITKNHGVLFDKSGMKTTDWVVGSTSPLAYKINNPTGNWKPYIPPAERQSGRLFDTMACVTFSLLNCIEMQLKFYGSDINFSDRFIAKMSGTTPQGNYTNKVADTFRKLGDVLEARYGWNTETFDWNTFYAEISQEIIDEASKILTNYDIAYEYVPANKQDLIKHLKHSPIQILVGTCPSWNTGRVKACSMQPNHAVALTGIVNDNYEILDHYAPFEKVLDPDYIIFSALKIIIQPKTMTKKYLINDHGKLGVFIIEGFTGSAFFADTPEHYEALLEAFDMAPNSPTINIP